MIKTLRKSDQNGFLSLVLLLLVIVVIAGGAAYYAWQRSNNQKSSSNQQATTNSAQSTAQSAQSTQSKVTTPKCTGPSSADIANVKDSITSGNTAALEGYMSDTVKVILAATEGIGDQTPAQAVADVSNFISGTSSWDFALPAATLASYRSTPYATYFPTNAVIGKDATTTKVISFSFTCDGKINVVFEAGQESLVL